MLPKSVIDKKMNLRDKYIEAYNTINKAKKILLVTHNQPDGDALSSISAVGEYITSIEKDWSAYCFDEPPYQFKFLKHIDKINSDKKKLNFSSYDLIIACDCGSLKRTYLVDEISNRSKEQKVIEFDHHPKIDNYSNIEIRDDMRSSTAEVLYFFYKYNKIKINKNVANAILTGILTDTGNFLFSSTTEENINIASEMMMYGAKFPTIIENTWRNKSIEGIKLWGSALNNLKINKKYNFAYSILEVKETKNKNVSIEELEGIPEFLSNLYGVKGLVLLKEQEGGKIKGSLRTSHDLVNISHLARKLNGGGHKKASGFQIEANLIKTEDGWKVE